MARSFTRFPLRRLFAALGLALAAWAAPAQERGLAARVNGSEISILRLERYFEDFLHQRGRDAVACQDLKRQALDRLIDRELLIQEAERRGIAGTEEELAEARSRAAAAFKNEAARQRHLAEGGFTEAAFEDYLRREVMARKALLELMGPTEPGDEEVARAYRERHGPPDGAAPAGPALEMLRQELAADRRAAAERRVLQELRQGGRVEVLLPL